MRRRLLDLTALLILKLINPQPTTLTQEALDQLVDETTRA
jgi:hypothetical protein